MSAQNGEVSIREEQIEDLARRVANKVVSLLASHAERIADDPPPPAAEVIRSDAIAANGDAPKVEAE